MERWRLIDRHPRLFAGLWFGAFLTVAELTLLLAFWLIASHLARGYRWPTFPALTYGCLMLSAGCAGAWLGSELLDPDADPTEVIRRGAWIGIVAGIGVALLSPLVWWAPRGNPWGRSAWATAFSAVFQAGRLLPVAALGAWCLVCLNRFIQRRNQGA